MKEKWNANIVKEKIDTIFSEKLRNVWKKTDELYEIWCFIQIIKTVENLDFKIISGWVFDGDVSKDLDEGTVIVFEREEVKVKLHYNSKIKDTLMKQIIHILYLQTIERINQILE
ncbi:nuclease domain-containing protein [Jeotgalicoccus sp. WY2]|uniref:nuclease domain-containing protein n=1 Tax=Jeotgalicoccus sp. WY2 TaxID=2708346 RepID=UPI001BD3A3DE